MTAHMDAYKHENKDTTHLIGQDWQKLIDIIESRPGDSEIKSFDGGGSQYSYLTDDSVMRTFHDVKRLREKDMPMFGRCPETDNFYTVVCSSCSMILMPHAFKEHCEKRHGNNNKFNSPNEKQSVTDSSNKIKTKKVLPVKSEKMEKCKRVKTGSLADLTEDAFKDSKRIEKLKKGRLVEKLLESEISPVGNQRGDKGKQKCGKYNTDLQPVVALSPILVENETESNESKDLPKSKKRENRKKCERKIDKTYDPDKHCGVINDAGKPCVRSILCKVHQVAMKRAVPSRTMPYDMLIRVLKSQNDDEKIKADCGPIRKIESGEKILTDLIEPRGSDDIQPAVIAWTSEQITIKREEPPSKRLKIKDEVIEDDVDQSQFSLPSHLEALIDETLKTLKDVEERETIPMMPVVPKSEPLVKWDLETEPSSEKPPSPPPQLFLDDIHWHSSHPKPLATNTFGCRLIGGLMSTCKKLDTLRKHLQSVWSSSASSAQTVRTGLSDGYNSNGAQNANSLTANSKTSLPASKYVKKLGQSKSTAVVKRNVLPVLTKGSVVKRRRRSNSNMMAPVQKASPNATDIISGLLIGNSVPVQRTGTTSVPAIPTGVIPVNSITGNGVPLRLFQGSLPVIASTSPNQPPTFIQLNLCPPK